MTIPEPTLIVIVFLGVLALAAHAVIIAMMISKQSVAHRQLVIDEIKAHEDREVQRQNDLVKGLVMTGKSYDVAWEGVRSDIKKVEIDVKIVKEDMSKVVVDIETLKIDMESLKAIPAALRVPLKGAL